MKPTIIAVVILLFSTSVISQNYKYGKVSKTELEETQNAAYPEMNATILYRQYKTYYEYKQGVGFTLYTEVFERVKIYTAEGFDWATKAVKTYNSGSDREEVTSLKGNTFNLVNGSIEKVKLKNNKMFEKRLSNYYVENKFTMPNIKPGCVIEYEYKIASPFNDIDDIDLQYTIPIKREVIDVRIPEFYVYQYYSNPQSGLKFTFDKDSKEKEINLRGRSGLGTADHNSVFADKSKTQNRTITYKENMYLLEASNIPALKQEVYVDNLNNYKAKAIWELAMTNFPGGLPKSYSTTWGAVTKSIYDNDLFVNQIRKKNYYQSDLAEVLAGLDDPLQKMAAIFNLVKTKVKWNKYYGYFPDKGVKKAYNEGTGNTADINLMLVSMLQSANLNANPVLVSTKRHGIPLFPTRYGFNYVIAGVEYNGKLFLLDATDPFSGINLLPERTMNWEGRLIRPDGTSQSIGLYPDYTSKKLTYVQAEIKDGNIEASVRERLSGHYAKEYRSAYYGASPEEQLKTLETDNNEVSFSEFEAKDIDNLKPNMSLSYKATSSSLIEEINGNLYISPMLFYANSTHPFKDDSRNYPIFFGYPKSDKYTINIKIPEGYQVTSIPQGAKVNLANNLGSYTYLLKQLSPDMLQLSVSLAINSPIVLPSDYDFIKAFFSQIVEKEKEKVVLSKI